MAETEPTEQLTICPYGDLKLCLKTSSTSTAFLVSSHQLCYASRVFRDLIPESNDRRFFFSAVIDLRGLRAATPSDSDDSTVIYELDIDDKLGIDPTNMAVVLYAIHGRSEHFPETITFEKLLEIAVICEHYRCAEMMSPWDKLWMKLPELEKLVLQPGYEDWLFIARVFGNQELFGRITKQLARNVVKTEDGKLGVMVREEVKKMHSRLPERPPGTYYK
ncbi:hypothetical protein K440DRAFT_625690 [Wilcoxina mikolae CBS 423.85]|nr:hypothetical protein K440DRAFT_625690 [Wilcoxina mikolae CBS 423.85]